MSASPFAAAKVLVVGDVMLDRYWFGDTHRISPEAPVPIVRVAGIEERPGGAGNVALNVVGLGAEATLSGLVGDDAAAGDLEALLVAHGVTCRLNQIAGSATTVKLRVLSQNQQLIRLDFESPEQHAAAGAFGDDFDASLTACQVVVFSDYAKGALDEVNQLIGRARAVGKTVIVDPKGTDFSRYAGAHLLTPNLSEFEAVVGPCADPDLLIREGQALCTKHGFDAVLVTQGEKGMTLIPEREPAVHLPAHAREVFDVTGAGDTVCATLASAIAAGFDYAQATRFANAAAGIVVGKLGAAAVTALELADAMEAGTSSRETALTDVDGLLKRVAAARAEGERVVMTNGCFDLLHAGHVSYLNAAKKLGDRLIVALNDDESVRQLKGAGRPIVPLAERAQVLKALVAVDWVCAFSESTPAALIEQVAPDLLVKGGDYEPREIAGYESVTRTGGEVLVLEYQQGWSTSALIEKLGDARKGQS